MRTSGRGRTQFSLQDCSALQRRLLRYGKSDKARAEIMNSTSAETSPRKKSSDRFYYLLAASAGAVAGWVDIRIGDLLLTAIVVLVANMLLGLLRPRRPWRWVLLVGLFVPLVEWLAYFFLSEKPDRAQIYESFLAFVPGIAGAYGGSVGRTVVENLFRRQ
jgi:hypothetical protein